MYNIHESQIMLFIILLDCVQELHKSLESTNLDAKEIAKAKEGQV